MLCPRYRSTPLFTLSKHILNIHGTTASTKVCNNTSGVVQNIIRCHSFMKMFYKLRLAHAPDPVESPRLTPQMVTSIIRMNETSVKQPGGVVKEVHCNQLPANKPTEDRHLEAKLKSSDNYLFGVFDGHAGCACAQTLKDRLFKYIAVALSDPDKLNQLYQGGQMAADDLVDYLSTALVDNVSPDLGHIHRQSLFQFVQDSQDMYCVDTNIEEALKNAFLRMDLDISNEVNFPTTDEALRADLINIAFSGAVSCVAYIDGLDLYVANVGDCRAVIGSHSSESEAWHATQITEQHDAQNAEEVKRLCSKHPNERNNILKDGRLFGELMPLRAFGDIRYKWSKNDLRSLSQIVGKNIHPFLGDYRNLNIPKHFRTPPYLDAEPEIKHYRLTPRDRFLVISTDGLWDSEGMSVDKVVSLVGHHLDGRQVLAHFHPPENAKLGEINTMLRKRKSGLAKRAVDENVTTHLIRHALGLEHGQISAQLTLPEKLVRYYRDDITITVIYFDTDYIMDYTRKH
ncbi:pyruvate dehydrogenase [acetyl-transferring]-phosphatase 1 mitochondrial [Biomphalaria glabrata]